jgi:hypothetical protein
MCQECVLLKNSLQNSIRNHENCIKSSINLCNNPPEYFKKLTSTEQKLFRKDWLVTAETHKEFVQELRKLVKKLPGGGA